MKKSTLKLAIATASAALLSSSAMAYDVFEWQGSSALEFHEIQVNSPGSDDLVQCGPNCALFNGPGGGEIKTGFMIDNLYDASGNGPGEGNGGLGAIFECYDAEPERIALGGGGHAHLPTPQIPSIVPENSGAQTSGITMDVSNVCTSAEGKIVSGINIYSLNVGNGLQVAFSFDFDNRLQIAFLGNGPQGSGGDVNNLPSFADTAVITADVEAGIIPSGTFGDTNTWVFSSSAPFAYLTCDLDPRYDCATSGKAVPVPAFAAAALGLGMVGVTFLTSRRRAVKG